ncbi:aspartyl-tRNA(Asn)/glutamyl-tRNA(Gln) amidotransferase subunit A [Tistlia consotensis]|uniref:Aspartyl-tRNA(Asn)/glutamyl-tRNA(Gln) amidotransferase subunit A n=1 Tax=Tistlia consotensis USBA 355 TaxID=560819 RepID=A0A1Y6CDL1_9PROT|nr:amidase [Tistlia consotensis]SMF48791.1 aspartyl-tRNA(Asn)/glutamyl-tRNA(Gln) amidotransferase subunit A [Tistlia consotensis USBA 355]SNR80743.1 aspartyl-tRNA(Asn)/glutamyl-tRNA(Gln) amidotransferase subunit A [Tistlia consotensis]
MQQQTVHWRSGALALARETSAGRLSSRALVAGFLQRARGSQASLNAFAALREADALAEAEAADRAAAEGRSLGPLHGVPVSVKDILNVAGLPTRWGSRTLAEAAPAPADSLGVARLRAAGAIVLGKTTTSEFAHSMMGRSPLTGTTRNPWDAAVTCGGSSAGAGVSVAAGLSTLALATDAGCSVRLPAACTGVVGLKPTLGLVPHNGVPEGFANFIHLGLMARSVAEVALFLDVVAGPQRDDPHSLAVPAPRALAAVEAGGDLAGRRLLCRPRMGNRRLSAEMTAVLDEAVERFRALGAEVVVDESEIDNPEPVWRILQQSNWAQRLGARIGELEGRIDDSLVAGVREGLGYSGPELQRALYARTAIFRAYQAWFDDFDLLLTPVMARRSLDADHPVLAPVEIDGEAVGDMRREWTPYLNAFDLSGHPAISLPAGRLDGRLPVGIQLVGRWYADGELLRAAAAYEGLLDWTRDWPPVADAAA